MRVTFKHAVLSVLLLLVLPFSAARAQSILRDAETEAFLHKASDPLFLAAGLNPKSVHLYLIHDNSINAFVAGGRISSFTQD